MNKKSILLSLFTALALSFSAFSADPPTSSTAPVTKAPTAEEKAQWAKMAAPGENHKMLNDIVGKFGYTMKWWEAPEAKAQEAKGTSTSKWVLGNRFVQQDAKGKMMGQNYQGTGFTGYDNVKEEFQSVWMDSMNTGMMIANGTKDTGTGVVAQTGTFSCPMTNDKAKWFRTDLKVVNKNEHVFSMYTKTADGKEFKTMEITYKRSR